MAKKIGREESRKNDFLLWFMSWFQQGPYVEASGSQSGAMGRLWNI